jgi:hypothetical protein
MTEEKMNKRQILLTASISAFFTLTIIAGSMLFFSGAIAAPPAQVASTPAPQVITSSLTYLSVSSMAFMPASQDTLYRKDARRQMLTLNSQPLTSASDSYVFIAPLTLPDKNVLTGMTVYGEDFDNQGAVEVRLKRCDHSQARCSSLAETTSTDTYAAGQFETTRAAIPDEVVNQKFYSYFLELELTAVAKSGLRSVRLELTEDIPLTPAGSVKRWSLSKDVTSFLLPNQGWTQVRVCTDDLSHLNNPTHYPTLIVDGQMIPLSSSACVTVWGRDIEIRRELNTGASSGTYQFLR